MESQLVMMRDCLAFGASIQASGEIFFGVANGGEQVKRLHTLPYLVFAEGIESLLATLHRQGIVIIIQVGDTGAQVSSLGLVEGAIAFAFAYAQ